MVNRTDTFENALFNGNVTIINSGNTDLGLGDLEVQGSIYSNTIGSNLIGGSVNVTGSVNSTSSITGTLIVTGGIGVSDSVCLGNFITQSIISVPGSSPASTITLFTDTIDSKFKSIDNTGIITVYNCITSKGDLISSDGITLGKRLPVALDNNVLSTDSTQNLGLNWTPVIQQIDNSNNFYNGTSVTIDSSYTDIKVDQFRSISNFAVLNNTTNTDLIINYTGPILVLAQISLNKTVGTTGTSCTVKMVEDISHTGSGSFSDVPGALSYTFNLNTTTYSDSAYIIYAKNYTQNDRIKLQAIKNVGTDTIVTNINSTNINVINFNVDYQYHNTSYFNGYTTGNTLLLGTITDIILNTARITNSNYTFTSNTASITVNTTGTYSIYYSVNITKSSGIDNSYAIFNLAKNGSNISGSLSNTFVVNTTNGFGSTSNVILVSLTAGDIIKLQGKLNGGTNLNCSAGTNIVLVYLTSSINSQTSTDYCYLQQTTPVTLNATATDITFDTNTILTSVFTHSVVTNKQNIIINESGYYYLFGCSTITNTNASPGTAQLSFSYTPSSTFINYLGTQSTGHVNVTAAVNSKSITNFIIVYIPAGYTIKLQGTRLSTTGVLSTSGSTLSIIKANLQDTLFLPLNPFGSYFNYSNFPFSFSTSSTTYVPVTILNTGLIPNGIYKLDYSFNNSTAVANKDMNIQILLDGIQIIQFTISLSRATNSLGNSGFELLELVTGNHIIEFDINSAGSSAVSVFDTKMSFFRVK